MAAARRMELMAISLTESAATRVKTFLSSRGNGASVCDSECVKPWLLRIRVRHQTTRMRRPLGDVTFEDRGVKVFVDPASLNVLDGTTVDFIKQGLNEAFRFRNPNVKGECGCGESFSGLDPSCRAAARRGRGPQAVRTADPSTKTLFDQHFHCIPNCRG